MHATAPEHTVSIPEILRTAICEQISTFYNGKFIADKARYSPDASHEHAPHSTYLPRFFSSLAKRDCRPRICCFLSTMPRQKVKILRRLNFSLGEFSLGKIDAARQKVKTRRRCKSIGVPILGTLELSSIPIERKEIWNGVERFVGIIVDRPIIGKVGMFDAKA